MLIWTKYKSKSFVFADGYTVAEEHLILGLSFHAYPDVLAITSSYKDKMGV